MSLPEFCRQITIDLPTQQSFLPTKVYGESMTLNNYLIKQTINEVIQNQKAKKIFDTHGLCLNIRRNGGASWQYHYRVGAKAKTLSLGTYPSISLKEARILHQKAVISRIEGEDPALEKRKQKLAREAQEQNTFSKYCWLWFEMRSKRLSPKYAHDLKQQINRIIIPTLGHLSIQQITPPIVASLLNSLSNKGLGDTTKRTLQRINAVMNYAVQIGSLPVNPILSLIGFVQTPPTKHQLALKEEELTEFFSRLITVSARPQTKIALLITILTFVRVGSLRRVEWQEIDFQKKIWTIPAEKFKGGQKSLTIPLSEWVLSLFQQLRKMDGQESGYIFYNYHNSSKYMSENALSYLIRRMGYHGIATPHGFRSLATDILNEKSGFSADVIERQLGHIERNSVRRAYHRTEYMPDRISMMTWYSNYIKSYYDQAVKKNGKSIVLFPD